MKRAAIYARVSTNNGQHPEMQLGELRTYCERRGWKVAGEFVDAGISGAKEHRPGLDKPLSLCRKRLVDAVVVYRYDRFARSLRQLVNALEEFRTLGVDFISIHEGVYTTTANGRLVFGIFASVAEFERELVRGRVVSGLAAAKARGQRLGRPTVPVNMPQIALLRSEGLSWSAIGKRLGIGESTARRAGTASAKKLSSGKSVSRLVA
jgi:DNA invertase Pin-like site-specific DNA recombinase